MTLQKSEYFKYTTPLVIDKYGALLKRQKSPPFVGIHSIAAGVDAQIYGITALILLFLLIVSWCHERFNTSKYKKANGLWDLLLFTFPSNGRMWRNQFGATRKVLMATGGFAILILSALYEAKLSEQLLIPYPPPVVTLTDIEKLVESGKAQVLADNDAVRKYVSVASPVLSKSMKTAAQLNSPWISFGDVLNTINTNNTIVIDTESILMQELAQSAPSECANFVYVSLDEWTRMYTALIMRNGRDDILESMNVIVAERISYVDNFIQSIQLDKECYKHIFPVYTTNPTFVHIQVSKITGALALLFLGLCTSVIILFVEIIWCKWKSVNVGKKGEFQTFVIHLNIDHTFSSAKREEIYWQYKRLLEEIDG